jgi:hypothetical protein
MSSRVKTFWILTTICIVAVVLYFGIPRLSSSSYIRNDIADIASESTASVTETVEQEESVMVEPIVPVRIATHIATPPRVKAIYMSSWVAGTKSIRKKIIDVIERTEVNAIVIDIKDYTGNISYEPLDESLHAKNTWTRRIADVESLIDELHDKNIYVIGRVAVFQDPFFAKAHPEYAVKKSSDKSVAWADRKGIHWLDAGAEPVWEYAVAITKDAYAIGFDEINFDYIRFPSDGNMKDIYYPVSDGKSKPEVLETFFKYLSENLRTGETSIPISADLFGMTTSNTDDLGIGQVLEKALPYFDFIAPMVYPSHYPPTWHGFKNPAEHPYEVIKISMSKAYERAVAMGESSKKLRPWLQDFNLGAQYTPERVRAQITATYDIGLDSWMLWDPANTYTEEALYLDDMQDVIASPKTALPQSESTSTIE